MENVEQTPVESNQSTEIANSNNEKTFTQTAVNQMMRERLNADREKMRSELRAEFESQAQQSPSSSSNAKTLSEEDVIRLTQLQIKQAKEQAREEYIQEVNQMEANQVLNNFSSHLESAKKKYSDFEQEIGSDIYAFKGYHNAIGFIGKNATEHVDDIIYELGKNPSKLAMLDYNAEKNPQMALKDLNRLIKSIKEKEEAKNIRVPNQPLSQNRPSNNSIGSVGKDDGSFTKDDWANLGNRWSTNPKKRNL